MKHFLILLSILLATLFGTVTGHAWSLTCDPQTGVTSYDVEIDGIMEYPAFPAEADGSILYNIDHLADGAYHTFKLWSYDASGWGSDASVPFDARKPSASGNVRIIK